MLVLQGFGFFKQNCEKPYGSFGKRALPRTPSTPSLHNTSEQVYYPLFKAVHASSGFPPDAVASV